MVRNETHQQSSTRVGTASVAPSIKVQSIRARQFAVRGKCPIVPCGDRNDAKVRALEPKLEGEEACKGFRGNVAGALIVRAEKAQAGMDERDR